MTMSEEVRGTSRSSRSMTDAERERIAVAARPGLLGRLFPKSIFGTQALQQDLAEARVEVWTVQVETYAALDPPADTGFVVFIDVGNATLLGLACGDWIADRSISTYPDAIADVFTAPAQFVRAFKLERLPVSGMVLQFEVLDSSLVPATRRLSRQDVDYFGESIVLNGRLDTLRDDLKR